MSCGTVPGSGDPRMGHFRHATCFTPFNYQPSNPFNPSSPPLQPPSNFLSQFFITADRPNVAGLVLAGSADFKTELSQSDMFDPRLQVGRGSGGS